METAEEEVEQQAAILAQEGVEMDDDMAYALRLEKGLFTLQQVCFVGPFLFPVCPTGPVRGCTHACP